MWHLYSRIFEPANYKRPTYLRSSISFLGKIRSPHRKPVQINLPSERKMTLHKPREPSKKNIVWIDLEMSGLDLEKDRILEISCIVTTKNLERLEAGESIVIHQPEEVLQNMSEWCKGTHENSGLTQAVRNSTVSVQEAEQTVLEYVKKYCPEKECPLAGNTIYMDRMFLYRYMPTLNNYLHYRVVDVSSLKELCKRWNSAIFSNVPPKALRHRALGDIEESIEELKFYRKHMFNA